MFLMKIVFIQMTYLRKGPTLNSFFFTGNKNLIISFFTEKNSYILLVCIMFVTEKTYPPPSLKTNNLTSFHHLTDLEQNVQNIS